MAGGRSWGATADERSRSYPCDAHLPDAHETYFRATDVAAPAGVVFRWLCQLRAAPYSYDLLDNFGRRSPRTLTSGLERLARGQRFMTIFELVEFTQDRHITLLTHRFTRLFGAVATTYAVTPVTERACRLVLKIAVTHPGGSVERRLRASSLPWLDLVMARKQLLTLRGLAEANPAMLGAR